MNDISKAIKSLSEEEKKLIFNDGHNYMAFEIIYPPTKNVIDYGNKCLIQLHGVNIYDEKWNKVSEDKKLAEKLYKLLKQRNVLNQETF
jgi:ribonuclease HIII